MKRTAKMFVYGTLQPKGSLHGMIRTVADNFEPAVLHNFALYKHQFGMYPEITREHGRSVKGTLMDVQTNTEDFLEVMFMEINSGYALEILEVRTEHGLLISALGFTAQSKPKGFIIESGDWLEYENHLFGNSLFWEK